MRVQHEEIRVQNDRTKNLNAYLRRQLGNVVKQKRKEIQRSPSFISFESTLGEADEEGDNSFDCSTREKPMRCLQRGRRNQTNLDDISVEVLEFERRLNPDEFLEWLHTVERVFNYKEILEDKKAKLIALKLQKYACPWWTNLLAKRARKGKGKIRTWEKMKSKLKGCFLLPPISKIIALNFTT